MKFKPYPKYKSSGIAWLGGIPADWSLRKLAHSFRIIGSGTTPKSDVLAYYEDGDIAWLNTGDLNDGELYECEKRITKAAHVEHSSLKTYPQGSVVIAMYGATIGKLAILRFPTTVNQACCVFSDSTSIQNRFLFYWFLALRQEIVGMATGGGQPNISQDILSSLRIGCPTIPEQEVISVFLEQETAKIDTLIAKQEKLIELLKEKRQAVISHAVTKGLDPTVPMKLSGVEWLGDVPEHWTATALKRFWRVTDCKHVTVTFLDEGFPVASIAEIRNNRFDLTKAKFTSWEEFTFLRSGRIPQKGHLIFCRNASVGTVGYVDTDAAFCLGQDVCLISSNWSDNKYLYYQFLSSSLTNQLNALLVGSTFKRINVEEICNFVVAVPPIEEQIQIARHLDEITAKIDGLIEKAERAIELQKEHRTALISAAVTGKIDVREAVTDHQVAA